MSINRLADIYIDTVEEGERREKRGLLLQAQEGCRRGKITTLGWNKEAQELLSCLIREGVRSQMGNDITLVCTGPGAESLSWDEER